MVKLVFLGTRPLGYEVFTSLVNHPGVEIIAVVTEKGGKGWWGKVNIEELALEQNIPLYYDHRDLPEKHYDLGISALYHKIIDTHTISKFDTLLNLHMGELPRYRGTNCTAHVILNAEKDNYWMAGATLHHIDAGIDSGPIIDKKLVPFYVNTTNRELFDKVYTAAMELWHLWIDKIIENAQSLPKNRQSDMINALSPSYTYYRQSLSGFEVSLSDNFSLKQIWRFICGYQFPPFKPLQFLKSQKRYSITINKHKSQPPDYLIQKSSDLWDIIETESVSYPIYCEIAGLGSVQIDRSED